jgi:hypothetical protein
MNTEKFEKMSWIPFDLSRRICKNLYILKCLPQELNWKLPISVVRISNFFAVTFLLDDSGTYRQRYCINPVLLERCVLTKKEDFVKFTRLMNEALFWEEAKRDSIIKRKGLKEDDIPHFTSEDDDE